MLAKLEGKGSRHENLSRPLVFLLSRRVSHFRLNHWHSYPNSRSKGIWAELTLHEPHPETFSSEWQFPVDFDTSVRISRQARGQDHASQRWTISPDGFGNNLPFVPRILPKIPTIKTRKLVLLEIEHCPWKIADIRVGNIPAKVVEFTEWEEVWRILPSGARPSLEVLSVVIDASATT